MHDLSGPGVLSISDNRLMLGVVAFRVRFPVGGQVWSGFLVLWWLWCLGRLQS